MRLKSFAIVGSFAATILTFSSLPSVAATVGPLSTTTDTPMLVGDSATYATDAIETSPFDTSWLFSVTTPAFLNAFATAGNSPPNINPMTLGIYHDNGPTGFDGSDTLVDSITGVGAIALLTELTAPGNYLLRVMGPFATDDSGSVAGTLAILASPTETPLPSAVVLFGTGLAGMAYFGRRRRAKSSAA